METKTIIVAAVAAIAILLGAFILLSAPPANPPAEEGDYPNPLGGQNATMEEFATSLMYAERVYLVQDIRGLEKYPLSRNNIMQCGVDFAGSEGLVGKEANIYILEGNECSASEAGSNLTIKTVAECHSAVASAFGKSGNSVIWIEKGQSPSIYQGGLVVRINETYSQGLCSIRFVVPAPEEEPAQPAENVTWSTNIEPPSAGDTAEEEATQTDEASAPGQETPSQEAPQETETPAPVPGAD